MRRPITMAIVADRRTAAAPKSFAFFINGLCSIVMPSHTFSMAEFNASAVKTIPIEKTIATHSKVSKSK